MACLANGEIIPVQLKSKALFVHHTQTLANPLPINAITNHTEKLFMALSNISQNKIHHILTPKTSKHAWHLIVPNPHDWNQVANIIKQVLQDGKISTYGPVLKKELCCMDHMIEAIITPLTDGSFAIADA